MNLGNLLAYFKERFPLVNMGLFAILFLTVSSVALFFSFLAITDLTNIIWGIVSVISFFFRLRVSDEIKDYKIDMLNHPNRVLQSGRVNLNQLMIVSFILLFVELSWTIFNGKITTICWLILLSYSLLMRYEFFVSSYLKKRLLLYAVTHMLIMPFIILWIWSAFSPTNLFTKTYFLLASLSFLSGFCFEIARKTHDENAEVVTVDSYSKTLGFINAIKLILLFLSLGVFVQFYLLTLLNAAWWSFALIALLFISIVFMYISSLKKPNEVFLRKAELLVSLFMLFSYLTIVIEINF